MDVSAGLLRHWCLTFNHDEELFDVQVTEAYKPIRAMNTGSVLLTLEEEEIAWSEEEEEEEIDRNHRERFGW